MSNIFRAGLLLLILGSCGARDGAAPRNLDNACSILIERPHYVRAFRKVERDWGVEAHVLMAMIYQESKFISDNRPPHTYALGVIPLGRQSSALGYSQALDGTWDEYQDERGGRGANRTNINDALDFMGWYMAHGRTGWRRGTWRSKPWLVRIAGEVRDRSVMYEAQLNSCRVYR